MALGLVLARLGEVEQHLTSRVVLRLVVGVRIHLLEVVAARLAEVGLLHPGEEGSTRPLRLLEMVVLGLHVALVVMMLTRRQEMMPCASVR